jgi:hypothetical protein
VWTVNSLGADSKLKWLRGMAFMVTDPRIVRMLQPASIAIQSLRTPMKPDLTR